MIRIVAASLVLLPVWGTVWVLVAWKVGIPAEWQLVASAIGLPLGLLGSRRSLKRYLSALGTTGWMGPIRLRDDSMAQTMVASWSISIVALLVAQWGGFLPGVFLPLGLLTMEAGVAANEIDSGCRALVIRRFEATTGRRVLLTRSPSQAWILLEGATGPAVATDEPSRVRP